MICSADKNSKANKDVKIPTSANIFNVITRALEQALILVFKKFPNRAAAAIGSREWFWLWHSPCKLSQIAGATGRQPNLFRCEFQMQFPNT